MAIEDALQAARDLLAEEMASERASAEVLSAMGHVDGALHDLRLRDERLAAEQERVRIGEQSFSEEYQRLLEAGPDSTPLIEGPVSEETWPES